MDQETQIKKFSSQLERASWLLIFFGMLTQISTKYSFPSYNVILGFWGAYSAFSRHGRATFGFIMFSFFAMCLDVAFCSNNRHESTMFTFCLVMFILCLFIKGFALYQASRFFTSIGGAYSLESSNMSVSMYDSLRASEHEQHAGYYPPEENHDHESGESLMMSTQSHHDGMGSGVTAVTSNRHHHPSQQSTEIMRNMHIHNTAVVNNGGNMHHVVGNKNPISSGGGGRIMLSSSSIMQDPESKGTDSIQENTKVF